MKFASKLNNYYSSTLFGYVLVGAACNGFYQQRYINQDGIPFYFWILVGVLGNIILISKNMKLKEKRRKMRAILVDLCFVLPTITVGILLAPIFHDWSLIIMLGYSCVFVVIFALKNYNKEQ